MGLKIVCNLFFFLITIASCTQTSNHKDIDAIQLISVEEMDTLLSLEKVQIIDVRTPEEYMGGHIKGAINIDYRDKNFMEMLSKVDKTKPVAVYCKKGGRSGACSKIMKKQGFKKIYDLEGGITSWVFEGKTLVK